MTKTIAAPLTLWTFVAEFLLRKEAFLYKRLKHPSLLWYFGSLTVSRDRVLVLELMAGCSLYNAVEDLREAAASSRKDKPDDDAAALEALSAAGKDELADAQPLCKRQRAAAA